MTTSVLDLFLACFSPSLFWLGYWYYRGHLGQPRLPPVLAFFGSGILAAPLALLIFSFLEFNPFYEQLSSISEVSEWEKFAWSLFAIGPVEEMAKFVVAWTTLKVLNKETDPLMGGPIYAAATALGFATVENWYYMLAIDEVVWHRALTLPFNHVLFSSFWGVGLSLYVLRPQNRMLWLTASLALSFVYHGLYDYILLSEDVPGYYVLPLILALWLWLVVAIPQLRKGIESKGVEPP